MSSQSTTNSTFLQFAKLLFWGLGITLVGGVSYVLYNTLSRPVAALLTFLGGMIALYFYYVKWFVIGQEKGDGPPYQSPCPDYLSLLQSPQAGPAGGPYTCVDYVGVSNLTQFRPGNVASPDNSVTINPIASVADLKSLIQSKGLTWVSMIPE